MCNIATCYFLIACDIAHVKTTKHFKKNKATKHNNFFIKNNNYLLEKANMYPN